MKQRIACGAFKFWLVKPLSWRQVNKTWSAWTNKNHFRSSRLLLQTRNGACRYPVLFRNWLRFLRVMLPPVNVGLLLLKWSRKEKWRIINLSHKARLLSNLCYVNTSQINSSSFLNNCRKVILSWCIIKRHRCDKVAYMVNMIKRSVIWSRPMNKMLSRLI